MGVERTTLARLLGVSSVLCACVLAGCSLDFGRFNVGTDAGLGDAGAGGTQTGSGGGLGGGGSGGGGSAGTGGDGPGFVCQRDADDRCIDCKTAGDCDGRMCIDGMCIECTADPDCGGGVCESGACFDCRTDAECSSTEFCYEMRCIPDRKPSGHWLSAGGGQAQSDNYRLRISVGAPSPMGTASSSNYRVVVGPSAGRP